MEPYEEEKLAGEKRVNRIAATINDLFADWLYYDRKEDYELPRDSIEEAIELGEITVEEIRSLFLKNIKDSLE